MKGTAIMHTRRVISFLVGWVVLIRLVGNANAAGPLISDLDNTTWLVRSKAIQSSPGDDVAKIGDLVNWTITQTGDTAVNIRVTRNGEFIRDRAAFYSNGLLIAGTHSESNGVNRGVSIIGTVSGTAGKLKFKASEVAVYAAGMQMIGKTSKLRGKQSAVVAADAGKFRSKPFPASDLTVDDIVGLWQFTAKGFGLTPAGSEKDMIVDTLRITKISETEVAVALDSDPLGSPFVGHFRNGLLLIRSGSLSDEICEVLLLLNLSISGQPGNLKMKGAGQTHTIFGLTAEAVVVKVTGSYLSSE
jgi:hypothetical protein